METNIQINSQINKTHKASTATWIIGQDVRSSQDYIIHTRTPAFIAKISHDPDEGILSGLSYATNNDRNMYDFVWFDVFPDKRSFNDLMRQAQRALNAYLEYCGPSGYAS